MSGSVNKSNGFFTSSDEDSDSYFDSDWKSICKTFRIAWSWIQICVPTTKYRNWIRIGICLCDVNKPLLTGILDVHNVNGLFTIFTARVAKRTKVIFSQACVTSTPGGGGGWGGDEEPGHNTSLPPPGPGHNTSLPPRDLVTTPPCPLPRDLVTTPPSLPPGPGHNTSLPPPGTWSQHLPPPWSQHLPPSSSPPPPPGPAHNTSPPSDLVTTPPFPRDLLTTPPSLFLPPPPPPGPGHNTSPPSDLVTTPPSPRDLVTTPPSLPPRTWSQHLPPPWDLVTTPPFPRDLVTTPTSLFLPPPSPPPPPGPGHNTSPPSDLVTTPPSPRDLLTTPPSLPPRTWSQHLPPPWDLVTTPPSLPPPRGLCAGGRYASYWNAFLLQFISIYFRLLPKNIRNTKNSLIS